MICRYCGEDYEVNPRLNDGYCDGCRDELNRADFDDECGEHERIADEPQYCDACGMELSRYNPFCPECEGEQFEGWTV